MPIASKPPAAGRLRSTAVPIHALNILHVLDGSAGMTARDCSPLVSPSPSRLTWVIHRVLGQIADQFQALHPGLRRWVGAAARSRRSIARVSELFSLNNKLLSPVASLTLRLVPARLAGLCTPLPSPSPSARLNRAAFAIRNFSACGFADRSRGRPDRYRDAIRGVPGP